MALSRKQRITELQAVEARLVARCQSLQVIGKARVDYLRETHPGWLVVGGFASGFIAERLLAAGAGSSLVSTLLVRGFRLWPLLYRRAAVMATESATT